ncbi:c-type cytochrome [Akkermansiaceae bacterium]|nr:c-type cytochrome [Akkermansiaceae bacterium]
MMLRKFILAAALCGYAHAELVATFTQGDSKDVRMDRLPAVSVAAGTAPSAFLDAGAFAVEWTGEIVLKERRRLYFSFEGKGKAVLNIAGEEVLASEGELAEQKSKRLRLNPGSHAVSIRYESAEDGSGQFRLYWEEEEMPRQTIPPEAFAVEPTEEAKLGGIERRGRMAFTQQNCAKCHAPEAGFGASPMPETGEIAPILAGLGDRVSEKWLRDWIADPKALKPTTHMPRMVDPGTPEGLQQAADLAAFLMAQKTGAEAAPAPDPALAKDGGAHFHELGCVACHFPAGEAAADDGTGRVPLNNVASKFQPGELVAFLKKPEAYHPFTGMPNFQLSDAEATSLAAFLRAESEGKETKTGYVFPKGDATRGAAVSESLQCGTCHPGLPGGVPKTPSLDAVFKADWARKGCIAESDKRPVLPVPNLREGEREALVAFSKKGHAALMKDCSAEFAERQIDAKRCTACHSMDGEAALLSSLHGTTAGLAAHIEGLDERVDQSRPQLTFIGEMLYTSYIEAMLAGTAKPRPRPWLGTRMPAFSAYAKPFSEGLSRMHGFEPFGPVKVEVDKELAEIGKGLVGADGFGCTTCHGIGDQAPTAAFEVGAVNFSLTPERLREGYYHRWMDNPAAVVPGSKMPRYAEGNESQRGDILDGDARKQYEAIWQWLHSQ